jgi:hypothetical protein
MARGFAGLRLKHGSVSEKEIQDEKQSRSLVPVVRAAFCYSSDVSLIGVNGRWAERKFVYHRGDQSLYEKRSMQN